MPFRQADRQIEGKTRWCLGCGASHQGSGIVTSFDKAALCPINFLLFQLLISFIPILYTRMWQRWVYKVPNQLPSGDFYSAWEQRELLVYGLDSHQEKWKRVSQRFFQLLSPKPSYFIPLCGKNWLVLAGFMLRSTFASPCWYNSQWCEWKLLDI